MAQPVVTTLGEWRAAGTTVGAVEGAIGDLRRREERGAVRTAVLTLVVLPASEEEAGIALDIVHEMSSRTPTHAILVLADPAGEPGIDADVRVHAVEHDSAAVCFEDIALRVRGGAARHLDSVIEPFTLPDLPVAAWLPDRLPELDEPVLGVADRVVVDSRVAGNVELDVLRDLADICRRLPVTDLSWVRLTPWRELLAGLFEGAAFRPFLRGVRDVTVSGKPGPRLLLAGWLVSRLRLARAHVHLGDSDHASIEVVAEHEGHRGRFAVERPSDGREVVARADVEGGPSHQRTLRLRERSAARTLGQALARLGHDTVYEQAVGAALELSA